jgi:hypothetical protein
MSITPLDIDDVRAQADQLGVKYHHRAGAAKIQAAIDAYLDAQSADDDSTDEEVKPSTKEKIVPMTSSEYRKKYSGERKKQAGRLIRCKITCMNPNKREWAGEIISVGSSKLGTFKKFVPFDGREYHIPKIIFDALKERKYSSFYTVTDGRGQKIRKARLVEEFNILELPPLTKAELADLAKKQALADGQVNS